MRRGLPEWDTLEVVSVIAFTTEFVLRLLTTPDLNKFCTGVMNMVDLVAILPFYIEIMFPKVMYATVFFAIMTEMFPHAAKQL